MDGAIFLITSRRDPEAARIAARPSPATRFDVEACTFRLAGPVTATVSDPGAEVWSRMPEGWKADDFVSILLSERSADDLAIYAHDKERRPWWNTEDRVLDPLPAMSTFLSSGVPWMLVYLHAWEDVGIVKECTVPEALDYLCAEVLGRHPVRGFICFGDGTVPEEKPRIDAAYAQLAVFARFPDITVSRAVASAERVCLERTMDDGSVRYVWVTWVGDPEHGGVLECYSLRGGVNRTPTKTRDAADPFLASDFDGGTYGTLPAIIDFVRSWIVDAVDAAEWPRLAEAVPASVGVTRGSR